MKKITIIIGLMILLCGSLKAQDTPDPSIEVKSWQAIPGMEYPSTVIFGFVKAYIVCVCLFATTDIVYNSEKWPLDIKKSFTFSYVEKGSNYLIKEFPSKKEYEDAKEKVSDI